MESMFIYYLVALASVGFFIILAEVISNLKPSLSHEITRKVAHIGSAAAVSIWPFYLDWHAIQILGAILTIGVALSISLQLTSSIHDVKRKNFGEVLFGIAIIVTAFIATTPAIFCATILFLGLADGLAGVIGTLWGKTSQYRVFGAKKSVVGSAAFFVTGLAIMTLFAIYAPQHVALTVIIGLPLIATILESISVRGTDNITVPLLVVIALNAL